ncbi:hypothetical protein ECANGB1_276 [Enterospora canceri]|uniref:Uncharacterized protein n=1 Tax=Enterospora canceri TaxID=1081671 RepID=A0A1Y1S4H8_9MICR|nr:hypothetical protein ECANGB1_276 [Enterospora canceri]
MRKYGKVLPKIAKNTLSLPFINKHQNKPNYLITEVINDCKTFYIFYFTLPVNYKAEDNEVR